MKRRTRVIRVIRVRRPGVIKVVRYQRGSSVKRVDRRLTAKKPGKRRARSGRTYWETRRNRSDRNRKRRL